ncbi:phosphate signaling complex protein PhoU [Salinibacillus xinjiangensis]|uniref:Phosphate-specific transport system accessory protein PhoU n=1 Tax=Salinibacillus xinjiangensis TaxID=1229268 RepID=A0A6G1X715_9BACI|nr:phosphate signaling complex protein PhoU [Salinibacillus xinjiangensis]MRG86598.1 phosphate signaling complex protein PhoU [Salinibacillus xinjiangensis]
MTIRNQFDGELNEVKTLIHELANGADNALKNAVESLYHRDVEKAQEVVDRDNDLDKKELDIHDKTILLIAKQQPVASDLRRLVIALKISSDIERMADHAVNIAKATIRLGENHGLTVHPKISQMAEKARDMASLAIKAFEYEDISLARQLSGLDDEIDEMYGLVIREMLDETASNPQMNQYIMEMAFSARFIERYADHITNIGENIFYLVKGETYNLND